MKAFETNLAIGQDWEHVAVIILESLGFKFVSSSNYSNYDIEMEYNRVRATFEIKTDFYNNDDLVVEYEYYGSPSGIAITKARFWCFIFPYDWQMWLIRTWKLREMCIKGGDPIIGGDNNKSKMFRFSKMEVVMNFNVIDYKNVEFSGDNLPEIFDRK